MIMKLHDQSYQEVYGDDALTDFSFDSAAVARQAIKGVSNTGSQFINGVISGVAWAGGNLTYAFPDNKNDYHYNGEKYHGFGEVSTKIKAAVQFTLDKAYGNAANDGFALEGFTDLNISNGTHGGATLRFAESSYNNPTAKGYFPDTAERGGDVWFGPYRNHYSNAVQGNYEFATTIHEIGHALGLKHGHSPDFGQPVIPHQWDSLEYSVMTYKSYVGADPTAGYSNGTYSYPQTYMMADIAALQHMYGADFTTNSGNTTYSWRPNSGNTWVNGKIGLDPGGNKIFATIWDGGGNHDKYNLSAYTVNLYVDLRPGAYSTFKQSQLADLDASSNSALRIADGNIYNALQYRGDKRSLIEDAIGGSGNDLIVGNEVNNRMSGRKGNDTFYSFQGNDIYIGNEGIDTFIFRPNWDRDKIQDFQSNDKIDISTYNYSSFNQAMTHAANDGADLLFNFGGGDTLRLIGVHKAEIVSNDLVL